MILALASRRLQGNSHPTTRDQSGGSYRQLLQYPHFLLAVLAQFCYVGAQVGTWSYFIQYVQDYTHMPEKAAGYLLTGTLAGFGVGRFASSHSYEAECMPEQDVGSLRDSKCGPGGDWYCLPWVGWPLGNLLDEFLHVAHVPNHLCPWHSRPGAEHQVRRFAHRDGHHRRRGLYPPDGSRLSSHPEHGNEQ